MIQPLSAPVNLFDPALVLTRYPSPLALAYGGLAECATPHARLFALRDIIEVSLKFCAIVMLKDYLRNGARALAVDSALAVDLRRPQLGVWNHLWRETARAAQKMRAQSFAPPLVNFYFETNGATRKRSYDLIDKLIKFRNKTLAHGARPRDEEAERDFQATQPLIENLLAELAFFSDYQLLHLNEKNECEILTGCLSEKVAPPANLALEKGRLYLRRGANALSLDPFLLRERCEQTTANGELCPHTKIFFFNGGDRRPEFLDYTMNHTKRVERVADSLYAIFSAAKNNLSVELEASGRAASFDLMREMTRLFVGREAEEEKILQFISRERRGCIRIIGDPGIGKSALLSRIALDLTEDAAEERSPRIADLCRELRQTGLAAAFHFCTGRRKSTTEVSQILASLIEQLVKQYGAAINLPTARTLDALLDVARLAHKDFDAKALIVIDAVDEALAGRAPPEQQAMRAELPLDVELPEGVFVLVSSRRGVLDDAPLAPAQTLMLEGLSIDDMRQILRAANVEFALTEQHLNAVRRVSESNPLYIRLLVSDLQRGEVTLEEIEKLPPSLIGYFEDFIRRFSIDTQWTMLRDCLLLFAVARGHLSTKRICAMTDFAWADVLEIVEYKMQPILISSDAAQGEVKYQLFHEKFREFVLDLFAEKLPANISTRLNKHFVAAVPPELRATGEIAAPRHLQTARARILDYCRKWRQLPDDEYPLKHLPFHLAEAGAVDELASLLLRSEFLETKNRFLGETFSAAEDVRLLADAFLKTKRDAEIVELAADEHAYRRDGVIAALALAAPDERERIEKIVRALLETREKHSSVMRRAQAALAGYVAQSASVQLEIINARRAAIEISYRLELIEELTHAARDDSETVRTLLVPYIYRFWKKRRAEGWQLLRRLSLNLQNRFRLPNPAMIEVYGGACLTILIYHFHEPDTIAELRAQWTRNVRKILHLPENAGRLRAFLLRTALRAIIFLLTNMLRLLLSRQPTFQPINLREMAVSYKRPGREQRLGLAALKCLADPHGDLNEHLAPLFDHTTPYGLYLMMIYERVFVFHGARDPERTMRTLYELHQKGCSWFRQSALYAAFHTLKRAARVEDEWLAWYAQMTRETIGAMNATFTTGNFTYELIPHIAWAEFVFDKHRPTGRAQFIPEFYRAAKQARDVDYARRALEACAILSLAYERHELALDAANVALRESDARFQHLIINALAQIRFNNGEAADRFLEREGEAELARQISTVASNLKANDIMVWVDDFMNDAMIESDEFRAEIVGAFERAGYARNLSELLQQILKWVINFSVGEELLPIKLHPSEDKR
jgi:hypothetical protein